MKRTKTTLFPARKNFIRDDISVSGSASADETEESGSLSSGFIVEGEGGSSSSPILHGAQPMESEDPQDFRSGGSSPSRSMTPQEEEDSGTEGGSDDHPPPRTSTSPTQLVGETTLAGATSEKAVKQGKTWSAQATRYFLTFSQNVTSKKWLFDKVKAHFKDNLKDLIVGHELHADGGDHLHIMFELKKRTRLTSAAIESWFPADFKPTTGGCKYLTVKAGPRNLAFTYTYCGKEGDFIELNQGRHAETKKQAETYLATTDKVQRQEQARKEKLEMTRMAMAATPATREAVIQNILEKYPMRQLNQFSQVKQLVDYWAQVNGKVKPSKKWEGMWVDPAWLAAVATPEMEEAANKIAGWFNTAIGNPARAIRSKQLYLIGPPGCGKTTFVEKLKQYLKTFAWPRKEAFSDGWENFVYDLVVMDEFSGGIQVNDLNALIDGSTVKIMYKGRAAVDKVHNVPFLFVSNKTSNQVYHKYFEANPECTGTLGGEGGRLLEVVIPPGMKMWEAFILDDPDRDHAAPQDE